MALAPEGVGDAGKSRAGEAVNGALSHSVLLWHTAVGLCTLCEERELPWRNLMAHAPPYAAMTATLGGSVNPIFKLL